MKHLFYLPVYLFVIACSTSSNEKNEASGIQEPEAGAVLEETAPVSPSELKDALTGEEPLRALELLQNGDFNNSLQISDNIWMWYETDPFFKSWFVSESKVEEGPESFLLNELHLKDVTGDSEGNELLVYSSHIPYTYVSVYAFTNEPKYSNFLGRKILEAEFNGSGEDGVTTVEPDPEAQNFGITEEFQIKQDVHKLLSFSKFPSIDEALLASEPKPYNISSYYKFYAADLEEAERVLSGDEQHLKDLLDTLDLKNGYMRVILPAEGHHYTKEYVYWNLSDGRKLFAFNQVESDFIDNVYTSFFDFRAFNEGKWEPFDIGPLQDLMFDMKRKSGHSLRSSNLLKEIFSDGEIDEVRDFALSLPQRGKNISVTFMQSNGESSEPLRTVQLQFNDGKFEYQPE